LALAQLAVGAVVRHSPHLTGEYAPALFHTAVYFHLLLALLIVVHVLLLAWRCCRSHLQAAGGLCLVALLGLQIVLGLETWFHKYGLPRWASDLVGEVSFVNREADFVQNAIVTSHVAVGSLILAASLVIVLRLARQFGLGTPRLALKHSPLTEGLR
jgi:cytochrome c oxidase assembly protein subunit 15